MIADRHGHSALCRLQFEHCSRASFTSGIINKTSAYCAFFCLLLRQAVFDIQAQFNGTIELVAPHRFFVRQVSLQPAIDKWTRHS